MFSVNFYEDKNDSMIKNKKGSLPFRLNFTVCLKFTGQRTPCTSRNSLLNGEFICFNPKLSAYSDYFEFGKVNNHTEFTSKLRIEKELMIFTHMCYNKLKINNGLE